MKTTILIALLLACHAQAQHKPQPAPPPTERPPATASKPPTQRPPVVSKPAPSAGGFTTCPSQSGIVHGSLINGYAFCTADDAGLVEATPEDIVIREATDRGAKCYGLPTGYPPNLVGPMEFYSFIEKYVDGQLVQHQRSQAPFGVSGKNNEVHVQLVWQSHAYGSGGPGPRNTLTQTPVELLIMYEVMDGENRVTKQIDLITQGTKVCTQTMAGGDSPTIPSVHAESWTLNLPNSETPVLIYCKAMIPLLSGELLFADALLTIKNTPASN